MIKLEHTVLEMLNHLVSRHPELAAAVGAVAGKANARERAYAEWEARQFAAPSPHFVKQARLLAHGVAGGTWVETGTFRGETTELLRQHGHQVYTLEPEPALFAQAKARFQAFPNVEVINGPSETVFPALLPKLSGDVSFWLDGHYSGDGTFAGANDTPVLQELDCVGQCLAGYAKVSVLVDDIRLFDGTVHAYGAYPSLDHLVDWARSHGLRWQIEQDIFIAKNH